MSASVDRQVETTPYRKVLVYTMITVCKQELLLLELLSFQAACIAWACETIEALLQRIVVGQRSNGCWLV
jgi:hypothetical protein